MTTKTVIRVEQRHIDEGVKDNCDMCAVALAILDATGKQYRVRLGYVFEFSKGLASLRPTPDHVMEFLQDFDAGRPVSPFTFEIDLG